MSKISLEEFSKNYLKSVNDSLNGSLNKAAIEAKQRIAENISMNHGMEINLARDFVDKFLVVELRPKSSEA